MLETREIDYEGCSLEIAAELKQNKAVYCRSEIGSGWVAHYEAFDKSYRIQLDGRNSLTWVSNPEPCKRKMRLMSPQKAIHLLIENGWRFDTDGCLINGGRTITHESFYKFGKVVDYPEDWPSYILEVVK